ncbi:MAG: SdpI family protein [Marinicella sp.]
MSQRKRNKFLFSIAVVIIVTWLVAWWYEPKLPEIIPTHWNIDGEIDGWTKKPWGVYLLPVISSISSLLLMLLPKIAPKGFKLGTAQSIYELFVLIMAIFMFAVMVLTFESALDQSVDANQWIMVGIGILFVLIGNYLSKVPKNFFLGIRTPWTLSSDEVWYKTHRLGSWTFIACGFLVILGGFFKWSTTLLIVILLSAALVPLLYSLVIYKKIEGFDES